MWTERKLVLEQALSISRQRIKSAVGLDFELAKSEMSRAYYELARHLDMKPKPTNILSSKISPMRKSVNRVRYTGALCTQSGTLY